VSYEPTIQQKPAFHADGLEPHSDFDYSAVEAFLGEVAADVPERDYPALSQAVLRILAFICDKQEPTKFDLPRFGRRALALTWVVNPTWFNGKSLASLAEQCGTYRSHFAVSSGEASIAFGVTNGSQSRGWNRGKKTGGKSHAGAT
jgi:hypothetical protein